MPYSGVGVSSTLREGGMDFSLADITAIKVKDFLNVRSFKRSILSILRPSDYEKSVFTPRPPGCANRVNPGTVLSPTIPSFTCG